MVIMIVSEWFSEKMGYIENYLPDAFGKLGCEVHLVTSNLQVYGTNVKLFAEIYEKHLGDRIVETGIFRKKHYTLHRNQHSLTNRLHIVDLEQKIIDIKPDIVYCFEITLKDTLEVAKLKHKYNYKIFCESRLHQSIFKVPQSFTRKLLQKGKFFIGKYYSKEINLYYPIAPDVQDVITKYYGVPISKCKLASLGVNTDIYFPALNEQEKNLFRTNIGFSKEDIICLYTGRFTETKATLTLAKAINCIYEKGFTNVKALFVGQGDKAYTDKIKTNKNCFIHPFVSTNELTNFYCAADIGVWPREESTSQLDALSCGLPIIINDKVEDKFRIEGNGLSYIDGNYESLAEKIISLSDKDLRKNMGKIGYEKIKNNYSWEIIAQSKIQDFKQY